MLFSRAKNNIMKHSWGRCDVLINVLINGNGAPSASWQQTLGEQLTKLLAVLPSRGISAAWRNENQRVPVSCRSEFPEGSHGLQKWALRESSGGCRTPEVQGDTGLSSAGQRHLPGSSPDELLQNARSSRGHSEKSCLWRDVSGLLPAHRGLSKPFPPLAVLGSSGLKPCFPVHPICTHGVSASPLAEPLHSRFQAPSHHLNATMTRNSSPWEDSTPSLPADLFPCSLASQCLLPRDQRCLCWVFVPRLPTQEAALFGGTLKPLGFNLLFSTF